MLSYYTLEKLQDETSGAQEILDYYESEGLISGGTDAISSLIDNVYINANVIYTEQASNEQELLEYIQENYDNKIKTLDEAYDRLYISIIDGYYVYAVIEG